ncbi:MAG: hypothetical protein QF554_01605 [Dehalococcoidia bacterium]|jgi:hypothetical protein|nr:hypothetical protein [Dehalococcoidia bacterium]
MRRTRFIHAAGFRLDSPYSGLRNPSAVVDERLRAAPFEAFRNLQSLCESEAPDFLLIAGGVFNLADRSIRSQLAFRDGLAAIADAGVPVYLVHGPEDPAAAWLPTIRWPEGVHVMGGRPSWYQIVKDGETIALLQGASQQSSALPGPSASDFLAATDSESVTIGLVSQFAPADDAGADPLESLPELHYWAFGPEREGTKLSDPSRRILSAGPAQALSPTETGAFGCYIIETDEAGRARPAFVALDSVRWENVSLDISDLTPEEVAPAARGAVMDALARSDGRDLICRLMLNGDVEALPGNNDGLLDDLRESVLFERPRVWVDRVEDLTNSAADSHGTDRVSPPLLTALHSRYESIVNNGAIGELTEAAPDTHDTDADGNGDPGSASGITRDAYSLAVRRLSPAGDGLS